MDATSESINVLSKHLHDLTSYLYLSEDSYWYLHKPSKFHLYEDDIAVRIEDVHYQNGWSGTHPIYRRLFAMCIKYFVKNEISEDCWKDQIIMILREHLPTNSKLKLWMQHAIPLLIFQLESLDKHRELFWNIINNFDNSVATHSAMIDIDNFYPGFNAMENFKEAYNNSSIDDMFTVLQSDYINVIGFDFEWCSSEKKGIALMQIGLETNDVFIVNMMSLENHSVQTGKLKEDIGKFIFTRNDRSVIGFNMKSDLSRLRQSGYSSWANQIKNHNHLIDLEVAQKFINNNNLFNELHDYPDDYDKSRSNGLSNLVFALFGMCLNKQEKLSDWRRVPLRPAQVHYAGLDAYCLIQIRKQLLFKCLKCIQTKKDESSEGYATRANMFRLWVYLKKGSGVGV